MQHHSAVRPAGLAASLGLSLVSLAPLPGLAAEPAAPQPKGVEAEPAKPSSWRATMTDPDDGKFDMSRWLLDRKGFMPIPPDVSVLPGLATENGTWAGGGAHIGFWRHNTIRTTTPAVRQQPGVLALAA